MPQLPSGPRQAPRPDQAQQVEQVDEATLEDVDAEVIPEATPAASDLVCWVWAAIPPRDGRIHIARAAAAFGVSATTMRRWLAATDLTLNHAGIVRAKQLAILRSRGRLLWPDLDPGSRRRCRARLAYAEKIVDLYRAEPDRAAAMYAGNPAVQRHRVLLLHYPTAQVYAITTTRSPKTVQLIRNRGGEVELELEAPTRFHAGLFKYLALEAVDLHRCVAPGSLVPFGRSETWRAVAGTDPAATALKKARRDWNH